MSDDFIDSVNALIVYPFTSDDVDSMATVPGRVTGNLNSIIYAINESGYWGQGLGSNSLGLYFIGRKVNVEPGYAALIWEFGIIGFVLWLLLFITIWYKSIKIYLKMRKSKVAPLALTIVILVSYSFVYQFIGYQIMQNYIVIIYFWTSVGMLFSLNKIRGEVTSQRIIS